MTLLPSSQRTIPFFTMVPCEIYNTKTQRTYTEYQLTLLLYQHAICQHRVDQYYLYNMKYYETFFIVLASVNITLEPVC